ncbi:putative methyltransferase-domain-containing protein [Xylaria flabelliformis]|nr:putative methyltransferase-domain-containing protein [Xylaria flabelliformis]
MSPARRPLPPSSSLPAIRLFNNQSESCILDALGGLHAIYVRLPTSLAFQISSAHKDLPAVVDSGYASDNDDGSGKDEEGFELRDDPYERAFAERWLTGFLGRAEELMCFESEDSRQRAIDQASSILASFFSQDEEEDEDTEITRDYPFTLNLDSCEAEKHGESKNSETITAQLTDGLAGRDDTDHTDVGLQSWGAAFIFTELMCAAPARLNFTKQSLGSAPRIIELGAGTGLVGIALGKILPRLGVSTPSIIATDFHPTVLANLQANINKNFSISTREKSVSIQAAPLDWETPDLSSPLDEQADVLVATDVIYDPEHAVWLRDCAARMLKPDGVFWLMLTVRTTGKFEGISGTVRTSFNGRDGVRDSQGRVLEILDEERFARPNGIGRGDESEYRLFKIGWA